MRRFIIALFTFALASLIFAEGSRGVVSQTATATQPMTTKAARADSLLEQAIKRFAETSGGIVGVSAIHIETGKRISLNGQLRFPMASVYKFPIALQLLHRVDRGEVRLRIPLLFPSTIFDPDTAPSWSLRTTSPSH